MFHIIRSINRTNGTADNFQFELTHPINDIIMIELLEANIPTAVTDYFYIKISQFHNQVMNHNGNTSYSSFVVPHHHYGNPASDTEYRKNQSFEQVIFTDKLSVNLLNIQLCDDTGNPITGASDWSFTLKITQSH
jgi:hypothetical protein